MTGRSADRALPAHVEYSEVLLFNMAKGKRPRRPGSSNGRDPEAASVLDESEADEKDPLLSLRSQRKEERSCKDVLRSGCQILYDHTIASCKYSCCYCDDTLVDVRVEGVSLKEEEEDLIKRQLRFHFMNPFEKWRFAPRRRFPCKLLTQVIVILLCTVQLWIVATMKHRLSGFLHKNVLTFQQFFFPPDLVDVTDPNAYYFSAPIAVLYTERDLWMQLNYTATKYFNIKEESVGSYGYGWDRDPSQTAPLLNLCISHYPVGVVNPEQKYYNFFGELTTVCSEIHNSTNIQDQLKNTSLVTLLNTSFSSVSNISYSFNLSSIYLQHHPRPLCCRFDITVRIENRAMAGNMPVYLDTNLAVDKCSNDSSIFSHLVLEDGDTVYSTVALRVLEIIVVILSLISTYQCTRSLINSIRFSKRIKGFFKKKYEYRLKVSEFLPLYNLWFVLVTVSNILVIIGTILEMLILYQILPDTTHYNDVASITLGLGVFLQWCGMLRFLSYLDKYNMLLITIRVAMPSVLRFMFCAAILYFAFLLLGWLVLGSYHPKFHNPSVTSECLFSLINGDDMFNTFVMMSELPTSAFIFSKIYLYIFISLFIYVVLSVFISLISDTYETLHEEWTVRSRGLLRDFANDNLGRTARARSHSTSSQKCDDSYVLLMEHSTERSEQQQTSRKDSADFKSLMSNGGPLLHRAASPAPFAQSETLDEPSLRGHKPSLYPDISSGLQLPNVRIQQ